MGTKPVQRGAVGEQVSRSVRERRAELGISQADLAERLKAQGRPFQVSAVSKIEAGDRRVDVDDLAALAVALDVTPDQILSGEVRDTKSRDFLEHDAALAPVLIAARVARESTGLGYRAIADYLRLVGPTSDAVQGYLESKSAGEVFDLEDEDVYLDALDAATDRAEEHDHGER